MPPWPIFFSMRYLPKFSGNWTGWPADQPGGQTRWPGPAPDPPSSVEKPVPDSRASRPSWACGLLDMGQPSGVTLAVSLADGGRWVQGKKEMASAGAPAAPKGTSHRVNLLTSDS